MVKASSQAKRLGKPIEVVRAISELREWCTMPANRRRLLEEPRQEVEAKLLGSDVRAARGAAANLDYLWTWYSSEGAVLVAAGDTSGWASLDHALECGYWFTRIFLRAFDLSDPASRQSVLRGNHGGLVLAHALSNREWQMADSTAKRMIQAPDDGALGKFGLTPFEPAMVRVHELAYGRDASDWSASYDLGAYAEVFEGWESEAKFAGAIRSVCEFHLASVDVPNWYGAFERGGYKVFPVDVLAIRAVRDRLGLPMPKVDHPLLSTPLASPPARRAHGPHPRDELVQRVVAKAEAVLGGVLTAS